MSVARWSGRLATSSRQPSAPPIRCPPPCVRPRRRTRSPLSTRITPAPARPRPRQERLPQLDCRQLAAARRLPSGDERRRRLRRLAGAEAPRRRRPDRQDLRLLEVALSLATNLKAGDSNGGQTLFRSLPSGARGQQGPPPRIPPVAVQPPPAPQRRQADRRPARPRSSPASPSPAGWR